MYMQADCMRASICRAYVSLYYSTDSSAQSAVLRVWKSCFLSCMYGYQHALLHISHWNYWVQCAWMHAGYLWCSHHERNRCSQIKRASTEAVLAFPMQIFGLNHMVFDRFGRWSMQNTMPHWESAHRDVVPTRRNTVRLGSRYLNNDGYVYLVHLFTWEVLKQLWCDLFLHSKDNSVLCKNSYTNSCVGDRFHSVLNLRKTNKLNILSADARHAARSHTIVVCSAGTVLF